MPLPSDIDLMTQPPWSEYFSYEYDARTNWIARTLTSRLDESGETTYTDEQNRRLEYWDSH
jgi:hypothetical protein